MEIKIRINKTDIDADIAYTVIAREHIKRDLRARILYIIFIMLAVLTALYPYQPYFNDYVSQSGLLMLLFIFFLTLYYLYGIRLQMNNRCWVFIADITVHDEGISGMTKDGEINIYWKDFNGAAFKPKAVVLYEHGNTYFCFPKSAFHDEQYNVFQNIVRENIGDTRDI